MKTRQYVLRILISLIAFFLFAQCSNTGTNRTSAACRNQCLVEQSLCYLVTTQGGALRSAEPNLTCQKTLTQGKVQVSFSVHHEDSVKK
ncbi:hypothetical protein EHQ58_09975, partial [Leptospira ognonensis]